MAKITCWTDGGQMLVDRFGGTCLSVAEAFLRGELNAEEEAFVCDIVTPVFMDAAIFRMQSGLASMKKPEKK